MPAPEACTIILKRTEEIKSIERIALINNPVFLRLQSYKASAREIKALQCDDDIDSDDPMIYDKAYDNAVGCDYTGIELVSTEIERVT